MLKIKIDKVTVILDLNCPFLVTLPCIVLLKFSTYDSTVFNFSTRFFFQIVENRETQLSSLFLGPGDIFSKSYDENQIW